MDFCLHTSTLVQFIKEITTLVLSGFRYRVTIKRWTNKRSQAQNATWRMWMEETAKAMRARGVKTRIPAASIATTKALAERDEKPTSKRDRTRARAAKNRRPRTLTPEILESVNFSGI